MFEESQEQRDAFLRVMKKSYVDLLRDIAYITDISMEEVLEYILECGLQERYLFILHKKEVNTLHPDFVMTTEHVFKRRFLSETDAEDFLARANLPGRGWTIEKEDDDVLDREYPKEDV